MSNAAKYGALSTNSGSLTVSWTVDRTSEAALKFVWQEAADHL